MATLTISASEEKRVKGLGFLSNKRTDNFSARIITVNGKISAEQNAAISEAAKRFGNGDITFTSRLTVELPGVPFERIEELRSFLAEHGLETGGTGSRVRPVVSCKGTTCQYGLIDTFGLSEEIHHRFYKGYATVKTPHKFKIATGGCPNNCVKPDLNDLGIIGQLVPHCDLDNCMGCKTCSVETACPVDAAHVVNGVLEIDEAKCNNCGRCIGKCHFDVIEEGKLGYRVYLGGMWGKRPHPGLAMNKLFFDKEEALQFIENVILYFRERGNTGERFAQTIQRLGFDVVEKELLTMDALARKEEIIAKDLHGSGGATC
ncbi:Dissimilatory sulfite reductase (desulfoviridin) [Clostridiaceae bacterium JG1575]|nr:Dissimilatory sulfite reductase (desulfoviridin) [Clostridiaceae bacterium JG1575]